MATQLAEHVWWVECRGVNAYIVEDGDDVVLVDTGTPLDRHRLTVALDQAGYNPGDVDRVLLTHYDVDHVGGLGRLGGLEAPVYVGTLDAQLVARENPPDWRTLKGFVQRLTYPFAAAPDGEVRTVDDGDQVGSFRVFHTPGHTLGHVCYVSEALDVAFLGDLVREVDGELEPSPLPLSYDVGRVAASIDRLVADAPPFSVAAMGHGVPFNADGDQRLASLAGTPE